MKIRLILALLAMPAFFAFGNPDRSGGQITVSVIGQVFNPGTVVMPEPGTLLGAIQVAGGLVKFADLRETQLMHKGSHDKAVIIDLKRILTHASPDIELHDGDTIFIPPSKVFLKPPTQP